MCSNETKQLGQLWGNLWSWAAVAKDSGGDGDGDGDGGNNDKW